ncbi:major facilitator superfamily domain-containing protein [Mycena polygramma]|nr:major facilitator superfamily domain-containing protein [Mycena polygramma]
MDGTKSQAMATHEFFFIPIPKRLRYHPGKSFDFGLLMNLSFGFASTVTVSNLYYAQPLLLDLAAAFDVSYSKVSQVPTLVQAGYAIGVVLVSPLGDLIPRRQLILICLVMSTLLTVGLAATNSFAAFEALSFLVGGTSLLTAIMQPLAADLAPPSRRGTAVSVVISGLLLGVLVGRLLSGILGQFASWRTVYYVAVGAQTLSLIWLYLIIPDYPAKNAGTDLTYLKILGTMVRFAVTEPALIQSCVINFATSAAFTSFWVTLTFLLGGPLYNYSTLDIGLFGLVGIAGVLLGPLMGRLIDALVPWYSALLAVLLLGVFNIIQMAAGGLNIGAVVVVAFGLNLFRQLVQSTSATIVLSISEEARGRLGAINVFSLTGTAIGTHIYLHSGWRACAAFSVGLSGLQLIVLLVRGPHCQRYTWVGWEGGWQARRVRAEVPDGDEDTSTATPSSVMAEMGNGGEKETKVEKEMPTERNTMDGPQEIIGGVGSMGEKSLCRS